MVSSFFVLLPDVCYRLGYICLQSVVCVSVRACVLIILFDTESISFALLPFPSSSLLGSIPFSPCTTHLLIPIVMVLAYKIWIAWTLFMSTQKIFCRTHKKKQKLSHKHCIMCNGYCIDQERRGASFLDNLKILSPIRLALSTISTGSCPIRM